jgi:hypothetical protein
MDETVHHARIGVEAWEHGADQVWDSAFVASPHGVSHEIDHLPQPSRLAVDEQRNLHEPIQPSQSAPADAGVSPFRQQRLEDPLVLCLVGDHDAELLAVGPAHPIEHGSKAQEQLFEDTLEWIGRRHRERSSCDGQQPKAGIDGWERSQQRGQTVQEVEPDRPRYLAPGTRPAVIAAAWISSSRFGESSTSAMRSSTRLQNLSIAHSWMASPPTVTCSKQGSKARNGPGHLAKRRAAETRWPHGGLHQSSHGPSLVCAQRTSSYRPPPTIEPGS